MSTELRDLANNHLLFWSSYDSAIDAANQFFGPIDLFFRGDEASEENPFELIEELLLMLRGGSSEESPGRSSAATSPERQAELESMISEEREIVLEEQHQIQEANETSYVFSLFQSGDGSEKDPDGIPIRYLNMQLQDREAASAALKATLRWRAEHSIDFILNEPHPKFDICKEVFPHFFLGRDKEDHVIFLQRPALLDLELAKRNNLTDEELLMHYVFVNEYLWQILEANKPLGTMTSILDLSGLKLSIIRRTDIIAFLKKFVATMDSHYPQRSYKTLILNAPRWFNTVYKLISPLLRESTKSKIEVHARGKKQDQVLERELGDKAERLLPRALWSKKRLKQMGVEDEDGDSDSEDEEEASVAADAGDAPINVKRDGYRPKTQLEDNLRAFALSRLDGANETMMDIVLD